MDSLTEWLEYPYNMEAGLPQSKGSKREDGGRHGTFYDLESEVTGSFPQHPIGCTVPFYSPHQDVNTRG